VDPKDIEDLLDVDDNGDVVVDGNADDVNLDSEANVVPFGTHLEILDGKETEYITGDHTEYNTDDLPHLNVILNKVRTTQNKPLLWAGQMKQKFASIGIHTSIDLATAMDSGTVNAKLKAQGLTTLHSTTGLDLDGALHGNEVFGDRSSPDDLDTHLQREVELSRVFRIVGEQLDKTNIPRWTNAIIFKLRCVQITDTIKLYNAVVNKTLNRTLRAYGFVPFFEATILALIIPLRCSVQNTNRAPRGHRIEPDFRHGQV